MMYHAAVGTFMIEHSNVPFIMRSLSSDTERSVLEASGNGQSIKVRGVDFTYSKSNGLSSAIRTSTDRNVLSLDIDVWLERQCLSKRIHAWLIFTWLVFTSKT